MFRSLKVRNFRLFATGQLAKLIGLWAQITAQDWLVLQLTHDSATALGTVTALQFLPVLLLSLYGGKLADRYDKRVLLIWVNVIFAVLAAAVGILVTSGLIQLWHIFIAAVITGVINAVETPTRQAFVSELVDRSHLPNALSLSAATFNSARIIGPAVAGVAIGWFGIGPVFLVDAVLCTSPVIGLVRMRRAELFRHDLPVQNAKDARIIDGLRYTLSRSDLLVPIILVAILGMLGFNFQLSLAMMAKTVFHAEAGTFGLLTSALAIGALGGALASAARKRRPTLAVVVGAAVLFSCLEAGAGFAPNFLVATLLLVPTGFFMVYFAQAANQRVQLGTDAAFRGRVMALYVLVFMGTTPIGAPIIGWIMAHSSPRAGLWAGGLLPLAAICVIALWQVTAIREDVQAWNSDRSTGRVTVPVLGADGGPAVRPAEQVEEAVAT